MEDIKKLLTCPITCTIMRKPTMTPEGHTYEYDAIRDWVEKKGNDPMTRTPLTIESLKPNRALENIISTLGPSSFVIDKPSLVVKSTNIKSKINSLKLDCSISHKGRELSITTQLEEIVDINLTKGVDLVLIIDRSYSMSSQIEAQDVNNRSIETGITCLDLVKHAVKTIVKSMEPKDRLAIVIFDSEIEVLFEFTEITSFTTNHIISSLTKVEPRYQTNIWSPLHEGIKMVNSREDKTRNPSIVLLTDGQPNISPPRGEQYMFDKVKPNFPIFMFGFTYAVDSELLYDLSKKACFGFISDGSMLGTNFVNIIANILSVHSDINLVITLKKDLDLDLSRCNYEFEVKDSKIILEQKFIRYGIPINYYMENIILEDIVNIEFILGTETHSFDVNDIRETNEINEIKAKMMICDFLEESLKTNRVKLNLPAEKSKLENIICDITKLPKSEYIINLVKNLNDQILLAFSNSTYMNKWGIHYIYSWITGQKNNMKINFKDSAGELYRSGVFDSVVDKLDDIYNKLPPPKPTRVTRNTTTVTNMSHLNNRSGGCWGPNNFIDTVRGTIKISELRMDDLVKTKGGGVSRIRYIVKHENTHYLIKIGNLEITEWHPILIDNKWQFPINNLSNNNRVDHNRVDHNRVGHNRVEHNRVEHNTVYNLVLEENSNHIIKVNGIYSICMGHNYNSSDIVLRHEFYGNYSKVCTELEKCSGDEFGRKIVNGFKRSQLNNDVIGLF